MSVSRYVMELRRNPQKRIRANYIKESCCETKKEEASLAEVDLAVLDDGHDGSHGCGCQECEEDNSVLHEPEHSPGYMVKQNLFLISQMAEGLYHLVSENDMLPPWMEQKITTAFNEIQAVHRNAEYAKEEEREGVNHNHGDHGDLEEDLSIGSPQKSIGESYNKSKLSLPLVEEAKKTVLAAEKRIKNLATKATGNHSRIVLSEASRKLREVGTEVNAVAERIKNRSGGMR